MVDIIEDASSARILWYAGIPGERYMPGSGTEGIAWFAKCCEHCARDLEMNGTKATEDCNEDDWCPIIARSFVEDSVPEWIYGPDGQPSCTAFIPIGQPIPPPKDELTIDMFEPKGE